MSRTFARFVSSAFAFVGLLIVTTADSQAAPWTVTYLQPAGASDSAAWGGAGGQIVGNAGFGGTDHALLWNGNASSFVDLTPAGATSSSAVGISGAQQVGAADGHAVIWTGTAASSVDLNPTGATQSGASGISGAMQAGVAYFPSGVDGIASHAGMWSGTANSWIDLNGGAKSSFGTGISGTQVVGSVEVYAVSDESVYDENQAVIWNGAANSVVQLQPNGYYASVALGTDGTHQVGSASAYFPIVHPAHAALWSGTAASFVDLNPTGAIASQANGVFGDYQVGYSVFGSDPFGPATASLWNGTAASWEDLSLALTGSWRYTQAESIWSDGATLYAAGFGYNNSANRNEAILWSRPVPEPTSLSLLALGAAGMAWVCMRIRRAPLLSAHGVMPPGRRAIGPSPSAKNRACATLIPFSICLLVAFSASTVSAQVNLNTLRTWGFETVNSINSSLQKPGSSLFAETASLNGTQSNGFNGFAYVWPAATEFRVLDALTSIDPATYAGALRAYSDELYARYWDEGYRSGAGGGDRFYDDNAHLVVALAEAYHLTHEPNYLSRAQQAQAFVLQGEDSIAGGGIYFKQFDFSTKDAVSTLQGARGAAMLYRATGQQAYLDDATRLLTWAQTHIQLPDGMFVGWDISTNSRYGFDLVNAAGIGISTNLELYDATGNSAYLAEAERMANRTLTRYFDAATGKINDEGYWAFELVDALDNLYLHDHNPLWLNKVNGALVWLHDNKRDPNGHYDVFWGRNGPQVGALNSWNLNEQASVARAYLYTSSVPEPNGLVLAGLGLLSLAWMRIRLRRARGSLTIEGKAFAHCRSASTDQ